MPFPSEPFTSNKWLSLFTALDVKVSHPDPAQVCESCHELQRLLLTRMSIIVILEERQLLEHIIVTLEQTIHRIANYKNDNYRRAAYVTLRENISLYEQTCFDLLDTLTLIIEQCLSSYLSSSDTKDAYYRLLVRQQIISISRKLYMLWTSIRENEDNSIINTQERLPDGMNNIHSNNNKGDNTTTYTCNNNKIYVDGKICYLLVNLLLSSPFCDALIMYERHNKMESTESEHSIVWQPRNAHEEELWQEAEQLEQCITTHPSLLVREHILQLYENSLQCTSIAQELHKYCNKYLYTCNTHWDSQTYDYQERVEQTELEQDNMRKLYDYSSEECNDCKCKGFTVTYAVMRLRNICVEVLKLQIKENSNVSKGGDDNSDVDITKAKTCNNDNDDNDDDDEDDVANRNDVNDRSNIECEQKFKNLVDLVFSAIATCNSHDEVLRIINLLWYLSAADEKAVAHCFRLRHLHQIKRFISTLPRTNADVRVFMELFKWLIAFTRHNTLCKATKINATDVQEVLIYTCLQSMLKLLCEEFHLAGNAANELNVNIDQTEQAHQESEKEKEEGQEKGGTKNYEAEKNNGATESSSNTINASQHKSKKSTWDDQQKSGLLSFILSLLQFNSRCNVTDKSETSSGNKANRQYNLLKLFDGKVLASLVEILRCAAETREVQIFLPTTVSGSDYNNNHHNGNNLSEEVYLQSTLRSIANSVTINATFACKIIQLLMNMFKDELKEYLEKEGQEEQEVDKKACSNLQNLSETILSEKQNFNNYKEYDSAQLRTANGDNSWSLTLMPFLQLVIPLLMEIALRYPTLSVNYDQNYMEYVNAAPIASTFSRGMSSANLLYEQASHTYAFCHYTICQSALDALLSCLEIDIHCNLHSITWEALIPLLQSLFDFTQTSIIPSVKSIPYTICSLVCNKKVHNVLSLYKSWPQLFDHALNEIINACQQTELATNIKCPEHLMKTQMTSTSAAAQFVCTIAETIYEHQQNNPFLSSSIHEEMTSLKHLATKIIYVKAKVLTSISLYENIILAQSTWNATMSLNLSSSKTSNVAHSKAMSTINTMTLALVRLCAMLTRLEYSNNITNDDDNNTEIKFNDGIHTKELIKEQLPWLPQWQILVSFTARNNWLLAQASHAVLSNAILNKRSSSSNSALHIMETNKSTTAHRAHHYSAVCSDSSFENNNNIARALHSINKILIQYQYTITITETLNYLLSIVQTLESADNKKESELYHQYKSEVMYFNDHVKHINSKASSNAYKIIINRYFTPTLISEFVSNIFALPSPQEVMHIILSRFNVLQEMLPACVWSALRIIYNDMIIIVCAMQQTYLVELLVKRVKEPEKMITDLCARLQDTSIDVRARSQIALCANRLIECVKAALISALETRNNKTERKERYEGCYQQNKEYDDDDDDDENSKNVIEHNIKLLDKYSLVLFTASIAICTFPSFSSSPPSRCEEFTFAELEYNGVCALQYSLLRYFAVPNAFAAKSSWLSQCVEELNTLMQEWSKNKHNSVIMKKSMRRNYNNNKISKNSVHNRLIQINDVQIDKKNITLNREEMLWECKRQQIAMYLSIVSNYFANVQCNVLECNFMHQMADIFCTGLQCIGPIQMMTLDAIKHVMQSETGQMCLLMETSSTLQPTPIKKLCKSRNCFDLLLAMLMRGEVADEHPCLYERSMQSHNTKSTTSQIASIQYCNNKKCTKNSKNSKSSDETANDAAISRSCFDICTFLCGKSTNNAFVSAFIKHKCSRIAQRQLEQQYTNHEMYYSNSSNNSSENKITVEMWWRLLAAVSLHTEGQAELMRTATLLTIIIETASRVDLTGTLALLILRNLTFHDRYKAVLCQDARVLLTLKAVLLCISINELLCRLYLNTELIAEVYDDDINNSSKNNSVADKKQASSNSAFAAKATTKTNNYTINCANKDWSNMCKDNMSSNKYNNNGAQTMSALQYNLCMFCKRLNLSSSALIEWAEQVTKRDAEQRTSDESVVGVYIERHQELAASALLSLTYYHDREKFYVKQVMEQEPRVDIDKLISALTNHSKEIRSKL